MRSNRLQLNPSKTEFLWCASSRRQHQIDRSNFQVGQDVVPPATMVRNLGLYMDNDLSMSVHITKLVGTCFGLLRQIRSIKRSLPNEAMLSLITSFITSRLDYCNVAFAGLPQHSIDRLQAVLNAAAHLSCGARKFDHITPLLRDRLHWLSVPERVEYKLCLLVYKCLHNLAPRYLSDNITPLSTIPSRQRLRSSRTADVLVPATSIGAGDRAFCVAGPRSWNRLPGSVQESTSLSHFKTNLKTHLFCRSYGIVDD